MVSVAQRYVRGRAYIRFRTVKELFVNIYHIRVHPMFSMRAISLFLFVLLNFRQDR